MIYLTRPQKLLAYVAAGVIALLLLLWLGSKCTTDRSDYDRERAAWEKERSALSAQIEAGRLANAGLLERIASDSARAAPVISNADVLLAQLNRERAAKNDALQRLAARQRELADTTEMSRIAAEAIATARAARQEADTLGRVATSLRSIVSQQLQNIAELKGSLVETQARADSAIALAERAPVYEGDKLLGLIPLPSRQTSFIVGGAIGVATTLVVVHNLKE